jgi:hypothetical protein
MAIEYLGERTLDPSNSHVCFEVSVDGELYDCAIEEEALQALCDECSDPIDNFNCCKMLILDCTLGILRNSPNLLSESIRVEKAGECPSSPEGRMESQAEIQPR